MRGAPAALGRSFDFLSDKDGTALAPLLDAESAEDLALLFANLAGSDPALAARLFGALGMDLRAAVTAALARLRSGDPERLANLESRLRAAVEIQLSGAERLGRILSRMAPDERESLLGEVASQAPEESGAVERAVFPFEGMARLKVPDLRRLISAVPQAEWATALRGAPDELIERVTGELPAGPRALLREALKTPQAREKVQAARSKILARLHGLADRGQVSLSEDAGAELI